MALEPCLHAMDVALGGVDDQDDKLIPAKAPDHIRFAEGFGQYTSKLADGRIPAGMTKMIVDRFQAIQIDVQQAY